jgi:hypothetical protein
MEYDYDYDYDKMEYCKCEIPDTPDYGIVYTPWFHSTNSPTSGNNYHVDKVHSFKKEAALTAKQSSSSAQRSLLLMRRLTISDLE